MGTIIVLIVIAAAFSFAFYKTLKARKKGGCSSCSGCAVKGSCQNRFS